MLSLELQAISENRQTGSGPSSRPSPKFYRAPHHFDPRPWKPPGLHFSVTEALAREIWHNFVVCSKQSLGIFSIFSLSHSPQRPEPGCSGLTSISESTIYHPSIRQSKPSMTTKTPDKGKCQSQRQRNPTPSPSPPLYQDRRHACQNQPPRQEDSPQSKSSSTYWSISTSSSTGLTGLLDRRLASALPDASGGLCDRRCSRSAA